MIPQKNRLNVLYSVYDGPVAYLFLYIQRKRCVSIIVLLQQQQNPINAHHVINNARIVMNDTSKEPSRCALLAYVIDW
jgi:hypothetical protein